MYLLDNPNKCEINTEPFYERQLNGMVLWEVCCCVHIIKLYISVTKHFSMTLVFLLTFMS